MENYFLFLYETPDGQERKAQWTNLYSIWTLKHHFSKDKTDFKVSTQYVTMWSGRVFFQENRSSTRKAVSTMSQPQVKITCSRVNYSVKEE